MPAMNRNIAASMGQARRGKVSGCPWRSQFPLYLILAFASIAFSPGFSNQQSPSRPIFALQTPDEIVKWYKKAAEGGNAGAQCYMGIMYRQGRNLAQNDELAVRWYRKAAAQGHPAAQCYLGMMYKHGRGVEKSDVEAVRWYRKAAEQGNTNAQCFLGVMYRQGKGVDQSDAEAVTPPKKKTHAHARTH